MSAIIIPEILIYKAAKAIVITLKNDLLANAAEEEKSILYGLLGKDDNDNDIALNTYNYFKQSKNIFSRTQGISINLGYNLEVAKMIALHIILPSETADPAPIGSDEGYNETEEFGAHTHTYNSTYQIMITSENSMEVSVVYHVLKAMFATIIPNLEFWGLKNLTISGNDIVFQDDRIPVNIFHKVINFTFKYEVTASNLVAKNFLKKFVAECKAVE